MSRRDTIVEQYRHEGEHEGGLDRVVMISIDPSSAEYILDWAMENFIRPDKDLVVLVHVRALEVPLAPYADATGYLDEVAKERKEESHELLRTHASRLWHQKIACKAISMIGEAKTEIVRKATEIKADALIMGSRQMGTIKRTLLGSVSDHCVHHAPCAVIIARTPSDQPKSERRRSIFSWSSS